MANKGCLWCGRKEGCDCKERMACPKAGQIGHHSCGVHPCGCPRFIHAADECPKKQGIGK